MSSQLNRLGGSGDGCVRRGDIGERCFFWTILLIFWTQGSSARSSTHSTRSCYCPCFRFWPGLRPSLQSSRLNHAVELVLRFVTRPEILAIWGAPAKGAEPDAPLAVRARLSHVPDRPPANGHPLSGLRVSCRPPSSGPSIDGHPDQNFPVRPAVRLPSAARSSRERRRRSAPGS